MGVRNDTYACCTDRNTETIDVSKSWDTSTVEFNYVNKSTDNLQYGALFPASDNESFFQFGGEVTWVYSSWLAPPANVRQFTFSDQNDDPWSIFNEGDSSGINNITRPANALSATVDNTFFMLGGYENGHTSQSTMDIPDLNTNHLGGILAWNMSSGLWTNSSIPSSLDRPSSVNGMFTGVPNFGPVGLLLAAGVGLDQEQTARDYKNITIYEPSAKTWHYQATSGDIPAGRDAPCTVGIPGDNGTYEM